MTYIYIYIYSSNLWKCMYIINIDLCTSESKQHNNVTLGDVMWPQQPLYNYKEMQTNAFDLHHKYKCIKVVQQISF